MSCHPSLGHFGSLERSAAMNAASRKKKRCQKDVKSRKRRYMCLVGVELDGGKVAEDIKRKLKTSAKRHDVQQSGPPCRRRGEHGQLTA